MTANPVFTIGHSTHSFEEFVALLQDQSIAAVTDVRSVPCSRVAPQFNRETLERGLKQYGIKYVFLGTELGGRSKDPSCYEHGRVQYARLAQTSLFQTGIQRVVRGAESFRLALMCSEREPLACHRTLLVARVLNDYGLQVKHILSDGRVESQDAAIERLLDLIGFSNHDLFKAKEELVAEAFARQESRVAHTDEKFDEERAADSV